MGQRDIIIVDKQDITRVGLTALANETDKVALILYAESKAELAGFLGVHPDAVVILDYTLSDFAGVDELLNISYRFPWVNWLLFSDELSYDFLRRLTSSSESSSIVLKSCGLDEINMGLAHTLRGERFICGRVTNQLLQVHKSSADTPDHILTGTEREILKEIATGKTTKEIAAGRNLSFHTVITHRKNIFRKLEVNNVHEATKYAVRAGLADPAEYYI
jgi:DNA-binding NarL/FixJ family response regulator